MILFSYIQGVFMGTLKNEMIYDMKYKGYSIKTIKNYTYCVHSFSKYFMKNPLYISKDQIINFFSYLRSNNKSESTIHIYYESLKYFYKMHNRLSNLPKLKFPRINNKIPVVLSKSDIQIFLQKCNSLKYKTIFSVIYSAGLRISEATNLKLSDLDFSRKTIYIRNSKNKKDRYTILADETIKLLKDYINIYRPIDFVFYSNDISKKISTDCIHKHFKAHIRYCEFDSTIHVHTLRHCFATHLLEEGTSIFYIMNLLGHSNIQTTMVYLHMQSLSSLNIKSPIDNMTINSTDKLACRNFELISA